MNTIIAGNLSADLGIDAGQLGLLTSTYFIAFASMQLPLGIWLDRFGPRKTEAFLLLLAAVGAAVFALAESFNGLLVGRALIGFGVSACLMAGFKAFVQWFPLEKLALTNGILLMAGGLGALTASTPIEFALSMTDWRGVFLTLSAVTVGVAILVWWLVPDKPETQAMTSTQDYIQGIKQVFTARHFWDIVPWSVSTQGVFLSTISLWSGPWFRDVAVYDRDAVAQALFAIGIGIILGYGLLGLVTERLGKRGFSTFQISIIGMLIYMVLQLGLIFEYLSYAKWIWVLLAFFGTSGILAYAELSQRFPTELAGRVNTAINLLVFVFAFFAQWGIGEVIAQYSEPGSSEYTAKGYQVAFICLWVIQALTMLYYFANKWLQPASGK